MLTATLLLSITQTLLNKVWSTLQFPEWLCDRGPLREQFCHRCGFLLACTLTSGWQQCISEGGGKWRRDCRNKEGKCFLLLFFFSGPCWISGIDWSCRLQTQLICGVVKVLEEIPNERGALGPSVLIQQQQFTGFFYLPVGQLLSRRLNEVGQKYNSCEHATVTDKNRRGNCGCVVIDFTYPLIFTVCLGNWKRDCMDLVHCPFQWVFGTVNLSRYHAHVGCCWFASSIEKIHMNLWPRHLQMKTIWLSVSYIWAKW